MRVDNPTHEITPAVTDRHVRWPAVNDLDEPSQTVEPAPVRPATRVETRMRVIASEHAALPPVGDFWDLQNPDRFVSSAVYPALAPQPFALPPRAYAMPIPTGRTVAPAASLALTTGLLSVPGILVFGLGALLGMIAVVSGAVALRQINRAPTTRYGTGRAVAGIITGTGSVLVGGPILLVVLLLAGL